MKKLLILTVAVAASTVLSTTETAQADHCRSFGRSGVSIGSSYRPAFRYYRPSYNSYRPSYSSYGYGYRPSYYSRGTSFGFSGRGFSISFGSGFRPRFGNQHHGHRH